jgi:hypothetical protein
MRTIGGSRVQSRAEGASRAELGDQVGARVRAALAHERAVAGVTAVAVAGDHGGRQAAEEGGGEREGGVRRSQKARLHGQPGVGEDEALARRDLAARAGPIRDLHFREEGLGVAEAERDVERNLHPFSERERAQKVQQPGPCDEVDLSVHAHVAIDVAHARAWPPDHQRVGGVVEESPEGAALAARDRRPVDPDVVAGARGWIEANGREVLLALSGRQRAEARGSAREQNLGGDQDKQGQEERARRHVRNSARWPRARARSGRV